MKHKRSTLENALELLENCRDELETESIRFNIGNYSACYIGIPRRLIGLRSEPLGEKTDEGNGPELTVVLEALDRAALRSSVIDEAQERVTFHEPGKLMETCGFCYDKRGESPEAQHHIAIAFFRKAITLVREALESA